MANHKKSKEKILGSIFKSPEVRYGFRVFSRKAIDALVIREEGAKYYIICTKSGKKKVAKPEEVIRQLALNRLISEMNYPKNRIDIEVPIKMGSAYASKKADIVVYKEDSKETSYIVIEVKKPNRTDGLEQLHSYMNATGVYYGGWINGNDEVYQLRVEPNIFETIQRLPAVNEDIDDIREPIKKKDLKPIHDLKGKIQELENLVLANAGVSAFDAVFPLVFAKLWDENDKDKEDAMEFRTTTATPQEQYKRLNGLFKRAIREWRGIFDENDRIQLTPEALIPVASALQYDKFFDTELDVIDAAFEYMINPEQKGDKGQYFTPRQVVKMCIKMLNPKPNELALDPACGACGFMIHTLNWVYERYIRTHYRDNLAKRKSDYANSKLYAIDFDPRLVRVAMAMMLIAGDGRSNVHRVNSLDPREWENSPVKFVIKDGMFDVVMTNPPFAGEIKQPEILGGFDLAYKGDHTKNKRVNKLTRDVLFLERCLRFLKPGGRIGIVLPQSNLNNVTAGYVREFMIEKARILAIVGLDVNTFKPFTGTKTSVLFLQKWQNEDSVLEDYPIFMATSERSGKNNSGDYVFKKDKDGQYVDESGTVIDPNKEKKVIDHDLDEIAEGFIEFASEQRLNFWR